MISVIDKKIKGADEESRKLEKEFSKGSIDKKSFIESYLEKRKLYH